IQRAVDVMRRHRIEGAIANIGTIVAHGGPPFLIAYSASKGALTTMTRGVANALKQDRIRINTLNIGWTNTPREHVVQTQVHGRPENWLEMASRNQPFGRLIEPDEVARALAFLCSDESGLMTGAVIDFDQTIIGTMDENPGV
ncbi:MAG TPA: SDR family oxidoreductase, partial [Geminicoccaceae bacterium]